MSQVFDTVPVVIAVPLELHIIYLISLHLSFAYCVITATGKTPHTIEISNEIVTMAEAPLEQRKKKSI